MAALDRVLVRAALATLVFLAAVPRTALAGKCAVGEAKAAGGKASCKLGVFAKAAAKAIQPDAGKLTTCETKFSAAFAKAQSTGGCPSAVSAGTIESTVDSFVNDVDGSVAVSPPSKCQSAKLKAAGKKAKCRLGVDAKGLAKDVAPDQTKLAACDAKLAAAFAKAETGSDCGASAGDHDAVEAAVDAFEADVVGSVTGATTTTTPTTTTATTTTSTLFGCCGFAGGPARLEFTTVTGSGACGTIKNATGVTTKNLACGGLYTGGGSNSVPLPYAVPDMEEWLAGVSSCSGSLLTLTNLTATDTGSNRNCTSTGCLFGAPLPIPNASSTPTSVCVINTVATDASGFANCINGVSDLSLPLTSTLYLDGDLLPARPGIQTCPVCLAGACVGDPAHDGQTCTTNADCGTGTCALANTCHGGPNDGLPCTPADSAVNASFPTSHDCPPPPLDNIGGLPIGFDLSTGTQTATAVNNTASGQNNVFCGYCRDFNGAGTTCFEGEPNPGCPMNAGCITTANPFACCTGPGVGTCDHIGPKSCTSNADCTDGSGTWPDCVQRTAGAFGPAGGGARTITESGAPAGNLTDGSAHASTVVSVFCIPPTFNATVDVTGDLPGPGAVAIPGAARLLP